jgi:hypothetical protein
VVVVLIILAMAGLALVMNPGRVAPPVVADGRTFLY